MRVRPRSTWTTRANGAPTRTVSPYEGAAVHWPGITGTLSLTDHASCEAFLRTLERNAVNGEYSALPYQVAACVHGLTAGRTVQRVNGANGSTTANRTHGSIVVLVGTKDPVTAAHKEACLGALGYLNAPRLVTHNDIRPEPTACPGPDLTAWIHAGAPPPTVEDDSVQYLSVSMDPAKPLTAPAGEWTRIKFHTEAHDDWSGHTSPNVGEITLPAGIVSGGVQLSTNVAVEVRVIRGTRDGAKTTLAFDTDGPGRFVLAIPPAVSKDSVFVEVRPVIAAVVDEAALRLTVAARS